MIRRFITKKIQGKHCKFVNKPINNINTEENKIKEHKIDVMDTKEKVEIVNAILNQEQPKIKRVKKEKGLIEKIDSSIITEDNRELLRD